MRPGRACAARGRDGRAGGPVSVGIDISSMGSVSRARFPSAQVSPARAAAPPGEEANQRLGGDESRARRGTGTGVARRARCACVSPRGSRTGHVARHGCRVGLRKAARGGRARGSVFASTVSWSVFSSCRGNDENVRDRGILEECDCTIGLLSGFATRHKRAVWRLHFSQKLRLFASELFLTTRARSTSRSKRQAANRRFCTCENRRGASAGTDLSPPPCRRPIETAHRHKLHTPPVTMSDYGSDVEDDSEHTLANVGFHRRGFVFKRVSFPTSDAVFKRARARRGRRPPARFPRQISRSTDPASLFTP